MMTSWAGVETASSHLRYAATPRCHYVYHSHPDLACWRFVCPRAFARTGAERSAFALQAAESDQYGQADAAAERRCTGSARAINLQRLLDRKGQIATNIQSSNQYLSAADSSLASVSSTLIDLRGQVVGITGTLSNESQRQQLINNIDQALQSLVGAGNSKLQGRYLFAGSRSQDQPYDFIGPYVQYSGNEGVLRSYVDLERLFDTNLSGTDVFGGISKQIEGGDLNPQLSADTLLSTINGGQGIPRNAAISISINLGSSTKTSVIDLSHAVTLGDVAKLIERGAPSGTEVVADITGEGLKLSSPTRDDQCDGSGRGHDRQ